MIKEDLVQFIWQFQYFNTLHPATVEGEEIQVLYAGLLNKNQGPDFLDAKIKIGDTLWAGNVEIHVKTTDWNAHKHSTDERYKNIILHVVWQHDREIDQSFPTLELQDLVSVFLLKKYQSLMQSPALIPCAPQTIKINELSLTVWKEKLLLQRLKQRGEDIGKGLQNNYNDHEEALWQRLARSFGVTQNTDCFEAVAKEIPLKLLSRHRNNYLQIEALLMGQAGLLKNEFSDAYPLMLQKEYRFLKQKYELKENPFPVSFLRMRPANFPTIRLAQLAAIIFQEPHLFSKITTAEKITELEDLLKVNANDYWHYHYIPDEETPYKIKNLGRQMKHSIIINCFVPVVSNYAVFNNDENLWNRSIQWLQELPAEKNTVTSVFTACGIENKNAADSQALLQLKNNYCDKKRCLECAIGNAILKN